MTQSAQDLLILYEPEAAGWASYLRSVFSSQLPHDGIRLFDVARVTAGQMHDPLALSRYRCKLLVLTPALVEQVEQDSGGGGAPCRVRRFFLCRVLAPATSVVVLLCGMESLAPLLGLVPLRADQCLVVSTEHEPEEYLDAVIKVVWGEAGRRGSRGPAPDGQAGERTNDAPSVGTTAAVNPPPRPESGGARSPRAPGTPHGLRVVPLRVPCGGSREMFVLLSDKAAAGGGDLELEFSHRRGHNVRVRPERWNQHVLLVRPPPDFPSGRVVVTLYCGPCTVDTAHVTYCTPLDDIAQLLTRATDPVDFMCQALQVSSLEDLDQKLSSLVMDGLPSAGLQELGLLLNDTPLKGGPHHGALPTLLHFAAQYGLRALGGLLLQVPGARRALATANRHGMTPGALAQSHGHAELSALLGEALGEGAADNYHLMSAADEEEEEEEEEDEEDPYSLIGSEDWEYDNITPAPVVCRAPASTPRPDSTTTSTGSASYIAQVFKNKTSKGNADLLNFPLEGQGRKASSSPSAYDAFILGSEGLVGAPGAEGGLDGPLSQLPGRVRRGSVTMDRALEMIREWQRLHCRGPDPQQQERLNRLRANVLSSRPDGDDIYDKLSMVQPTKPASAGHEESQPGELYSLSRKGSHSNAFGRAEPR